MSKEDLLKEKGYDIRTMLTYFANYKNYKKMLSIDYTIADVIVERPSEEEIQNFINKAYDILNRKDRK